MSAFIVISAHRKLDSIVDGIIKCCPLNPDTNTYISTGRLDTENSRYEYNLTYQDKKTDDVKDLGDLLQNQIAHFRKDSRIGDGLIRILLLENPTSEDEEDVNLLLNNIRDRSEDLGSLQVIHAIFTYDTEEPQDVSRKLSGTIVAKRRANIEKDLEVNINRRILCLGNQDENDAAICRTRESHDMFVSKMLCGFMSLLSSVNDTYNINASISTDTEVFSLGFAEYNYSFVDVSTYLRMAHEVDLLKHRLYGDEKTEENTLDVEKAPWGIKSRAERLAAKYNHVPFDEDIMQYEGSIDKSLDEILLSFKELYNKFRSHLLEKLREEAHPVDELEVNEDDELNDGQKQEQLALKLANFEKNYPEFISREQIYISWENDEEGEECSTGVATYKQLFKIIKSNDEFKGFVRDLDSKNKSALNGGIKEQVVSPPKEKEQSKGFFSRIASRIRSWFGTSKAKVVSNPGTSIPIIPHAPAILSIDLKSVRDSIKSIQKLEKERASYFAFVEQVENLEREHQSYQSKRDAFKLYHHCKSVGSFIDFKLLKQYQKNNTKQLITELEELWKTRTKYENITVNKLFEGIVSNHVEKLKYIDWENPFEFTPKIDDAKLTVVCNELGKVSCPFINYTVFLSSAANNKCYLLYSDCYNYINQVSGLDLHNKGLISTAVSTHVESSIMMLQVLKIDESILKSICKK